MLLASFCRPTWHGHRKRLFPSAKTLALSQANCSGRITCCTGLWIDFRAEPWGGISSGGRTKVTVTALSDLTSPLSASVPEGGIPFTVSTLKPTWTPHVRTAGTWPRVSTVVLPSIHTHTHTHTFCICRDLAQSFNGGVAQLLNCGYG